MVAIGLTVATTLWYDVDQINQWDACTVMFWELEGVFTSLFPIDEPLATLMWLNAVS